MACVLDVGCGVLLWYPPYGVPWMSGAIFGVAGLLLVPTIFLPIVRVKQIKAGDNTVTHHGALPYYDSSWTTVPLRRRVMGCTTSRAITGVIESGSKQKQPPIRLASISADVLKL